MQPLANDKKYYWSPSVRWEKSDNELRIEIYVYPRLFADIFPKFYYLAQKGMNVGDLIAAFPTADPRKLKNFISDLIRKKILIDTIMTPQEIFFPQSYLFKNEYGDELIFNPHELHAFKMKQLNRISGICEGEKIPLREDTEYPSYIKERQSYRTFDTSRKVSFEEFSRLFSILKQIRDGEQIRYYYASAGGLYPVDIYIHVKENRVENVRGGLYYYSPLDNSINVVTDTCVFTDDCHYYTNKPIFNASAFSVFLVYNAGVTMPKYKGMGYFYACIDSGIITGALTQAAELCGIGLCSIGDMDFKKIEKYFKLDENQVHLHTIEVGLKTEQKVQKDIF